MFWVNKIVGGAVSPVGISVGLFLVGAALAYFCSCNRLFAKASRALLAASIIWIWLWATPFATWVVGLPLESAFLYDGRVPSIEQLPEADAIVLLGGGMSVMTNLSDVAEMGMSADRVWMAARLWKTGKAPRIIATGPFSGVSTGPLLADLGVCDDAVSFDEKPRNTEEEAKAIAQMGFSKVLVVSSAWHMRRVVLMFQKYAPNVTVVPAATDFEATSRARRTSIFSFLLPGSDSLMMNEVFFREWIGYAGYWLFRRS